MNPEKKQISFDDLGKFNDFIEKVKILDDYLSQLSSKSENTITFLIKIYCMT